jgi:hypothetical protein
VLGKGIAESRESGRPTRCLGHDNLLERATQMDSERMAETFDRFPLTLSFVFLVHQGRDLPEIFPGFDLIGLETRFIKFSSVKFRMGIAVFELFS